MEIISIAFTDLRASLLRAQGFELAHFLLQLVSHRDIAAHCCCLLDGLCHLDGLFERAHEVRIIVAYHVRSLCVYNSESSRESIVEHIEFLLVAASLCYALYLSLFAIGRHRLDCEGRSIDAFREVDGVTIAKGYECSGVVIYHDSCTSCRTVEHQLVVADVVKQTALARTCTLSHALEVAHGATSAYCVALCRTWVCCTVCPGVEAILRLYSILDKDDLTVL